MQKDWIRLKQQPAIEAFASVVGKKEHDGPLGGMFDLHSDDDRFGMDTWEKAESEMQRLVFNTLLKKAKRKEDEIDVLFAGDLQNQCTGSSYGLLDFNIPYIGLYGACSTMAESLILSSFLVDAGTYSLSLIHIYAQDNEEGIFSSKYSTISCMTVMLFHPFRFY